MSSQLHHFHGNFHVPVDNENFSQFVTVFGKNGLNKICVRMHFNAF